MTSLSERYLNLLKLTLTHTAYSRTDIGLLRLHHTRLGRLITRALRRQGLELVRVVPTDEAPRARLEGRDWPIFAQTMVGIERIEHLQSCVEAVIAEEVPGDLIEAGAWRGGASIFMRGVLAAHGIDDRRVYVADSFEGLPAPDAEHYPADAHSAHHRWDALAVSLEEVVANFERYGLLDDQVSFVKGWFRDTLPTLSENQWAVIRLDGDMYESTINGLDNLYPGLAVGGYVIIDDYGAGEECRRAVDDYRRTHRIDDPIVKIDWTGVYWRRQG
jgi:O-methyltransferase